jgi:predicted Zn-dependent protease
MSVIEEGGPDYVLWPRRRASVTNHLLATGGWRVLYEDFESTLLVRAEHRFDGTLAQTPDSAYKRLFLGQNALREGRNLQAQQHFRRALELMPFLQSACNQLAQAQVLAGLSDGGQQTFEQCERIFPNPTGQAWFRNVVANARRAQAKK